MGGKLQRALTSLLVSALAAVAALPAWPGSIDLQPFGLPARLPQPIQLQRKEPTIEEYFKRADISFGYVQPVPLQGVRIPGLSTKGVEMLGFNYFVVVANTKYADMAEVYRDNRLRGKSNFVTFDSVIHPYLAFSNGVIAGIIEQHLAPELAGLLKAMLAVALDDYKQADDSEVRDDIERNIAYLNVALKLADPGFAPSSVGRVPALVAADMEAIGSLKKGHSAIFDRDEDFSAYQATGWWAATSRLSDIYRMYQWLSRMAYPITDVTFGTQGGRGNNFRRSVLLFRCLDLAQVNGRPAYDHWLRLQNIWALAGAPLASWQESTLLPADYKSVMQVRGPDLKVTLSALAEPFFRTKLMLTIRKQKPVQLDATSIFEIDRSGTQGGSAASFRLFPVVGDPEWAWIRAMARQWKEDGNPDQPSTPVALLVLRAWGCPQANNILATNAFRLDPALTKYLPDLEHSVMQRQPGGKLVPVADRRWQILSALFEPPPECAQQVVRTETWMNRSIESAFAAWVDSHTAYAPPGRQAQRPAATQPETPPAAKQASYHYLEPAPAAFRKIKEDAVAISAQLERLGLLSEENRARFADFARFAERLEKIAMMELRCEPLPPADMKLLGNIDIFLEKIVVPLPATLTAVPPGGISPSETGGTGSSGAVTFGLGRPGMLYVILQQGPNKTVLGRGAVYTYYEVAGGPIKQEHWLRKLQFDLVRPPKWTEHFDLVQQAQPAKRQAAPEVVPGRSEPAAPPR